MKERVLGKKYELSLVFVGNAISQKLNKTYRDRNKPTNVLSFPLDARSGEIFINLPLSRKQAPEYERDFKSYVAFLFIHGLFHLKGMEHGSRMERAEARIRKHFRI